jgi:hypothetical protein
LQGLDAPARQAVQPGARCWDALGVECFCPEQIGFAMKQGFCLCSVQTGKNTVMVKYPG